jgi:hypothetical protein
MASTRKSGKKARKTAKSSKAARTSKSIKASAQRATGVAADSNVDHPPVIVTDGSATIALDENVYRRPSASADRHISTDLRLISVGANRLHEETDSATCRQLRENEVVQIMVTTRLGTGGPLRRFTITGGNSADGSNSPVVEFDHGVFRPGAIFAGRRRFRNANHRIVSLEIFSPPGSQEPVHTCSVVEDQTNYEISIFDKHVEDK